MVFFGVPGLLLFNLSLRLFAASFRFLFLFFIATAVGVSVVADFGLSFSVVGLAVFVYGFEFHYSANRRLVPGCEVNLMVLERAFLYGLSYVFGGGFFGSILIFMGFDFVAALMVSFLCASQHFSMEIYRIIIRMGFPVYANLLLLIRDSIWGVSVICFWFFGVDVDIYLIFYLWLLFSVASGFFGVFVVVFRVGFWCIFPFDFQMFKICLKTGIRSLPGVLAVRGVFFLDRMVLAYFVGRDVLGVYVFFAGIASGLAGVFESGWLSVVSPKVVDLIERGFRRDAVLLFLRVRRDCYFSGFSLFVVCVFFGIVYSYFFGGDIYVDNLYLLPIVSFSYFWVLCSHPWNIWLYATGQDSALFKVNELSFLVMAICCSVGVWVSYWFVPVSVVLGTATLMMGKRTAALRGSPKPSFRLEPTC